MANFAKITPVEMGIERNKATVKTLASGVYTNVATNGATSATYGAYFEMKERDDKYLIALKNTDATASATAIIKEGNNGKWANGDEQITLSAGEIAFIKIDSGRFKNESDNADIKALANVTGSMKGTVVITCASDDLAIAVIEMPF